MPRPHSVTFLALLVLSIAAFNLLAVIGRVQVYTVLAALPLDVPPWALIAGSAVWGLVFAALALGLWQLRQWARLGTLAAVPLYLAQIWAVRLLFARSDYARVSAPFFAVAHLLLLALVWGLLWRRKVRQSFSS